MILTGDIKIFESDTMADTEDGGGEATKSEAVSGQSNNIFEDVSTIDRVFGAVHLRKIYPHVFIQSLDKYFGAHTIITKLPKDDKLGINLFSTNDYHDRRPSAQSRIESYRAKGAKYVGFAWATQWKGSKAVTLFQSENAPVPVISDVLYLSQNGDTENQFIKVANVSDAVQEFTIDERTFKRRIVSLEITQALEYDFVGAQMSNDDNINPPTEVLQTVVANAAKYYSARPMEQAASIGDTTIKATDIYSQVVPSSLQEVAEVNVDATKIAAGVIASSATPVSVVASDQIAPNVTFYVGSPVTPDTLTISVTGAVLQDVGGDILVNGVTIGTIDYAAGVIAFNASSPVYNGSKTISFIPATQEASSADTAITPIINGNRGNIYTLTILPAPRRGTVNVSFRSFGNWYDLQDNGSGGLQSSEDGIGTGVISYAPDGSSASITLTLSALPDVGSAIIWNWGSLPTTFIRDDETYDVPHFRIQLAEKGVNGSTINITWNDGSARTATADASGVISGDATGEANIRTGLIKLIPNVLPPEDTEFSVQYDYGVYNEQTAVSSAPDASGIVTHTLPDTNITPGSVEFAYQIQSDRVSSVVWSGGGGVQVVNSYLQYNRIRRPYNPRKIAVRDDGSGNLIRLIDSANIGTINYATGAMSIDTNTPVYVATAGFGARTFNIKPSQQTPLNAVVAAEIRGSTITFLAPTIGSELTIVYRLAGGETSETETFTGSALSTDFSAIAGEQLGASGLRFKFAGLTYSDEGNTLTHSTDLTTGDSTLAGTINKDNGDLQITSWNAGVAPSFTMEGLSTNVALTATSRIVGRVPNAPVRLNSFQIRAVDLDNNNIVANADASGDITGAGFEGTLNYDTGVYEGRFGETVVAAGNEDEYWYEASEVDGSGNIFKPTFVQNDSIVYDAVSQTFVPLDATILGLNPVRLPEDGRVPIFNRGDVVVVMNTATTSATFTSNSQTDLGRTRIASLSIVDANGTSIPEAAYTADLDTGLIDWADLSGIPQPIVVENRIEDMAVITDVQITGTIELSEPLTHDFPVTDTIISSAIVHGDVFAFVNTPFDQKTWTNEWSDALIGDETLAEFNDALAPIEVDNASAIHERWLALFTNSGTVNIIGEEVGQIVTGASISADIAPVNPSTGFPYFTIRPQAWGAGWSSGNALRFNTESAQVPLWIIQSVGQGDATNTDDDALTWCFEFRGDRDAP